jgi:hypothetical protein
MNLFDYFGNMNVFGAAPNAQVQSLLDNKLIDQSVIDKANRQSIGTGLVTGLASYLAQPKNLNAGDATPYIAKAFLNANKAAQAPFANIPQGYAMDTQIAEDKLKIQNQQRDEALKQELLNDPRVKNNPILRAAVFSDPSKVFESLNKPKPQLNNAQLYSQLLTKKNRSETDQNVQFTAADEAQLKAVQKALQITNPIAPTTSELLKLGYKDIANTKPFADNAPRNIRKYQKYKQAIMADKTFMGLQTDLKTDIARVASFFGAGGDTVEEKLANTQEIVQAMANRQLDAGDKLKGMPSDKEQELLQKAAGANYNNMTPAELIKVVELAIADEEHIIKLYNEQIDTVYAAESRNERNKPEDLSILDSYRVRSPNRTVVVDY